jgi:cation:H+ antiporter
LIAAVWLRVMVQKGQLRVWHIALNGLLYISYLTLVLTK